MKISLERIFSNIIDCFFNYDEKLSTTVKKYQRDNNERTRHWAELRIIF